MNSKEKKQIVTQKDIFNLLDSCYEKCLYGIPKVSPSVKDMANDYLKKHKTTEEACKAMLRNQIAKCTTSGVLTGFGGFITMPVAIPVKVLTKINQKIGFRFITKFGTKGIVNLGKLLPGVGAVIGGGLDLVETKLIADRAYKWFLKGDFSVKNDKEEDIIEIDDIDFEDEDF